LTTSGGTWTFGSTPDSAGDWSTLLNGTANGAAMQMQIANSNLYVFAHSSGHWSLWQNAAWSDVGSSYPNGTITLGGQSGSLITSEGTWTFGSAPDSAGDYSTLLNGTSNGAAAQMQLAANGNLYAYAHWSGHWYLRQNGAWSDVGAISPDELVIYGGSAAVLTTSEGTWNFGTAPDSAGDWTTQLNGAGNGAAVQVQITNGTLYAYALWSGHWYARQNAAWVDVGTTAPVEGAAPTPTAITLSPANPTIADNSPAGTMIATATVTMSDGSQFAGALATSNTSFFAISGLNIVTAQALTSANDGTQSTVITASQGGQSLSMEFSL
jgi:hypothetical protein